MIRSGIEGKRIAHRERGSRDGVVFWMLVSMGVSTFAPCILLPEWRTYEALRAAEQVEQQRAEVLARSVEGERRLLEAMRTDPGVIGRLAQRDLSFRRPEERAVPVAVEPIERSQDEPFGVHAVAPPVVVPRLIDYLPHYPYDRVFCHPQTRQLLMCLSVAIIAVAFALFGWERERVVSLDTAAP